MPKRKREEPNLEANHIDDDRALRIRKSRLVAQIDQGNILLHRALKLARGFERQKLGRRQKVAKENPPALLRLKEEVIVLKQLDLAKTAENHLYKQLVRTKRIREAQAFVALHGEKAESKLKGVQAGAEANVVGRLMNSNPVKEVLPEIMSKVYRCLGLEEVRITTKAKSESEEASPPGHSEVRRAGSEKDSSGTNSDWEGLSPTRIDHGSGVSAAGSSDGSTAESDDLVSASLDSQVSESDTDMAQYGHRLASSSASGPSSDDEEDETSRNRMFDLDRKFRLDRAASISATSSISLSRSPSPPPSKSTTLSHLKSPVPAPQSQPHTTFLPSLTLGGYFSGSDTDSKSNSSSNSDVNQFRKRHSHGPAPALPQPRKNRRGQRARQQIAEKKYGKSAKHLQKQQQQQQVSIMRGQGREVAGSLHRDEGWDLRKGATTSERASNGRRRGSGRQDGRRFGPGSKGPSGANSEAITVKERSEGNRNKGHSNSKVNGNAEGPIHPSWEAARKRKAQNQKVTALFQGKKITF